MHQKKRGKDYYNQSDFFEKDFDIHADLEGPFQRYRISKVLGLYTPTKEERVLDLGCGWGTFAFATSPLCKEVTGVDFSRKSVNLCNRLLKEKKFKNIKFMCAEAQNTGLDSESFDVIICADLVEHLYPEDFERMLDECKRLLRKRGKLLLWTPHRGHIFERLRENSFIFKRNASHVDFKSMDNLVSGLRKRKFVIKKSDYVESHLFGFKYLERLLAPIFSFYAETDCDLGGEEMICVKSLGRFM